jgi:hypothetical protein
MNLDELLNEKIKKVHGKWALVSKSNPDKVLQYYHGKDHPSKEWEKKVERRIHAFSHMNEADINKTIDDIRQNVHADELEGLKRYSNAQLSDWLKRLTAKNKSAIGPAMATVDSLGPLAKPFARTFVQRQYPTVDNDEFEQMWGVWNRMDDETRSAIKAGDLSTLDPRDEHGFIKETDDYDTWKQRAIERAKRQAEKKRAELQQATARVQQDPEKIKLQKTIQSARAELNKRKREAEQKMELLAQEYYKLPDEVLNNIIVRYSKGPAGAQSDFVQWLLAIKKKKDEERYGADRQMDLLRSVAGTLQGNQSQKIAPAQNAPWTQMGIDRKSFRKILNNPQHPKHREARSLDAQYRPVEEDLTRRDFLKGVGAVGALGLASGAAKAFGLKDPTKTADRDEQYKRFTGTSQSPLHADPRLDLNNKYNRVGVNQRGSEFSVVLTKDHGLYLYFEVTDFAESPYAYIELRNGEKYKFRKRTLRNNIFTIEDDRIAATLLNYEGPFNLYVDNDVYTFNIASSPDAQKLYRWWKEGKHEGL